MRKIPCTVGTILVDDEDYEHYSRYKWHAQQRPGKTYAMRRQRREEVGSGKRSKVYMHRLIMGSPPGLFIDHINGNGLDNRRSNLRIVTPFQNQGNRRKLKRSGSVYKGVRQTKYGRFSCCVRPNKKWKYLGTFDTEIEAAKRYDEYAKLYFGEFSNTNFKS